MSRRLIVAFLASTFPAASLSQHGSNAGNIDVARQVMAELYSLNHDRAEQICRRLITERPGDPLAHAMLARTLWARAMNNEQALNVERFSGAPPRDGWKSAPQQMSLTARKSFAAESQDAIRLARANLQANANDRSALLALGLAHLNLAAFEYSLNGDIWSAFRNGENAVDAHKRLLQIDPNAGDPHLSVGVALYLADDLPWKVKWLAVLFGFPRSREKGKAEIEIAARQGTLLADDARTMLVLLNQRDGQLEAARGFLNQLHQRYPRNYIVELELAGLQMRMKRFEEARLTCQRILSKAAGHRDGYEKTYRPSLYIKLGVSARESGRLDEACAYLRAAVEHASSSAASLSIGLIELGKSLDLQQRRSEALTCYRRASGSVDVNGSREQALRLIRRPYQPGQ